MKLFVDAARAHASSRASVGTRILYLAELNRWLEWCKDGEIDPTKPRLEDVTEFRDELQEELAPLTVRRILASLSSMYDAAVAREKPLATWNPFNSKALPRPPADAYTRTEAVSDDMAQKIIASAEADKTPKGRRDTAILRLFYGTGLRRRSVALMERAKVFKRGGVVIARVIVKGSKEVEVELPPDTATPLLMWIHETSGKYVFPSLGGGPITLDAINKMISRRAIAIGLGEAHLHPHQFRSAFATTALDSGAPLHEVQAAMHHSDPKTTLRYDRGVRGRGVTAGVEKFRQSKKEKP